MIAVIGDIHGCYNTLIKLLDNILNSHKIEMFIFIGDLIDRGVSSKNVIHEIMELSENYKVILILGNHEDMMFDYIYSEKRYVDRVWFENGGYETVKSFSEEMYDSIFWGYEDIKDELKILLENELNFLNLSKLYYIHKLKNYSRKIFFSHAGIQYQYISPLKQMEFVKDPLEKAIKFPYIWAREIDYFKNKSDEYIFIHGHTPVQVLKAGDGKNPYINKDNLGDIISINIDTGCIYEGYLSSIIIDDSFQFEFIKEKFSG